MGDVGLIKVDFRISVFRGYKDKESMHRRHRRGCPVKPGAGRAKSQSSLKPGQLVLVLYAQRRLVHKPLGDSLPMSNVNNVRCQQWQMSTMSNVNNVKLSNGKFSHCQMSNCQNKMSNCHNIKCHVLSECVD